MNVQDPSLREALARGGPFPPSGTPTPSCSNVGHRGQTDLEFFVE